jgi:surfactin synthase thioesterase subunit
MIIFYLALAGGWSNSYTPIFNGFSKEHTLIPLELPGHGIRLMEKSKKSISDILTEIESMVRGFFLSYDTSDYVIFGHSFGGLLGYYLTSVLSSDYYPPKRLYISSTFAPGRFPFGKAIVDLSPMKLWDKVKVFFGEYNGEVSKNSDIKRLLSPALKDDISAIFYHDYSDSPIIDTPTVLIRGKTDVVTKEELLLWKNYLKKEPKIVELQGDHFYCLKNSKALFEIIKNDLLTLNKENLV